MRDPNRVYQRAPGAGRPRIPDNQILAAIDYRRRTGCAWADLPRCLGAKSTIHRRYREMLNSGQIAPAPNWHNAYADPVAAIRQMISPARAAAALAQPDYNQLYPLHKST